MAIDLTARAEGLIEVQGKLRTLADRLKDRTVPNRAAGAQLYAFVIKNFETEGGGTREGHWKDLAPSTILGRYRAGRAGRAGKKGREIVKAGLRAGLSGREIVGLSGAQFKILQVTGHLRQSFAPFSDADQAGVGARASFGVDYAAVHEEGSGHVPQRKMLPDDAQALDIGMQVYGFYVERSIRESQL